ncbi:MAG: antirepressor regulating drug resistance protein [Anaerocolumna sp.]|nr:antirepressor regulating drug resistance protein [Anaerocolumna sp.]
MSEIFYWILNMSITGTLLGILLYLLRYIKKIPRFSIYALWSIVLIRLSIPFAISSKYSFMNLLTNKMVKSVSVPDLNSWLITSNYIQVADSYNPIQYKNIFWLRFIHISSIIWLIIAIALLMIVTTIYILNIVEMKDSTYLYENIYENKKVSIPMVFGIINPRIILPSNINPESLRFIIAHEKIHIKRHDNIFRMVAIFIACIHWFNPFIWFFLRVFLNDLEIACDAGVIKNLKDEDRSLYALSLLKYNQKEPSKFISTFGGSKMKKRIMNIITYKKLTILSTICFILLFGGITVIALTNASR